MVVISYKSMGVVVLCLLLTACAQSAGSQRNMQCKWNPSSCMYEGSYEPDEEAYAEQRAKELNKAAARKVRRRGW